MNERKSERRRRLINLGELIALGALVVSALGLWINWKGSDADQPMRIVEQRPSIPLVLRAKREDDGSRLEISPVEESHALESLKLTIAGASPIEVGSDGEIQSSDIQSALKDRDREPKDRALSIPVRIDARYVEAGKERRSQRTYTLRYMWKGGGLFGGRSLHLIGLSR